MIIKKIEYYWSDSTTSIPPLLWTTNATDKRFKGWNKALNKKAERDPA